MAARRARVTVIGGGAIGLAYACHLGRVPDVPVIDRSPGTPAAYRSGKLAVSLRVGASTAPLPFDFVVASGWRDFAADWVIVSTKATSTEAAALGVATPINRMLMRLIRINETTVANRVGSWAR